MSPATGVQVRPARAEDAPAVARVAEQTWEHDYPGVLNRENLAAAAREWYDPERSRAAVRDPAYLLYVAESDAGDIQGFVHAFDDDETGIILRAYVHPNARGEGIGRKLVETVCDALTERGCERVTATVLAENEAGVAFYESLGFEATGDTGETEIGGEFYEERTYARPQL